MSTCLYPLRVSLENEDKWGEVDDAIPWSHCVDITLLAIKSFYWRWQIGRSHERRGLVGYEEQYDTRREENKSWPYFAERQKDNVARKTKTPTIIR